MRTAHNWQCDYKQQNLLDVGNLARTSVRIFPRTTYTERQAVNALRRGWIKAVQTLGTRWLLHPANRVLRKQAGKASPDLVVFIGCMAIAIAGIAGGVL